MGRKKSRHYKDDGERKKNEVPDTNKEYHILIKKESPLTEELNAQHQLQQPLKPEPLPMKGRKARQFEKYLEKKLKKDRRPEMYERLKNASLSFGVAGQNNINDDNNTLKSTKDLNVVRKEKRPLIEFTTTNDGSSEEETLDDSIMINGLKVSEVSEEDSEEEEEGLDSEMNPLILMKKETIRKPVEADDEEQKEQEREAVINQTPLATQKSEHCLVERRDEIQSQRERLPIFQEEQQIMELIRRNLVVIICGETGSGKTTQVPQFLLEASYGYRTEGASNPGLIGVTQPRRVAALSMAERVQDELEPCLPGVVGHQVRFDKNICSESTRIKFMTDGILLKEIGEDFLLERYSVILLDEAHERNLNTDVLVGLLSRSIKLRYKRFLEGTCAPLRLVIMSATLDVKVFQENPNLFSPEPPLIRVEGRQHPVTVHFERQTPSDLIEAAFEKINKIHSTLPPGGILVFMTGQREIESLIKRLDYTGDANLINNNNHHDDFVYSSDSDGDGDDDVNHHGVGGGFTTSKKIMRCRDTLRPLPLYAMLDPAEQRKIFSPTPDGQRLCVISTNIAETSITIPGIKYVIDGGLVKEKSTSLAGGVVSSGNDFHSNAHSFKVRWISKASALQRTGRAGRLGPGHCYRLYSSALFEQSFPDFSVAEIERSDIGSLVLMLRGMGIDEPSSFPLPTPPLKERVRKADEQLLMLGAIERTGKYLPLTKKGLKMMVMPLVPRLSSILTDSKEDPLVCLLVSIISVGDPFLKSIGDAAQSSFLTSPSGKKISVMKGDYTPSLVALLKYSNFSDDDLEGRREFCSSFNLHPKRMEEARLQSQFLMKKSEKKSPCFKELEAKIWKREVREGLSRLICSSYKDQIAERVIISKERREAMRRKGRKVLALPAYEKLDSVNDWRACSSAGILYLHPSSIMSKNPPKFICFSEVFIRSPTDMDTPIDESEVSDSDNTDLITYISNVTDIDSSWL